MPNKHLPLCDQELRAYMLGMSSLFLERKNAGECTGFEEQKRENLDRIMNVPCVQFYMGDWVDPDAMRENALETGLRTGSMSGRC